MEAIIILAAIIRHHGISTEEILALPEIRKNEISKSAIQGFLEYHGLVKKIPDNRLETFQGVCGQIDSTAPRVLPINSFGPVRFSTVGKAKSTLALPPAILAAQQQFVT